MATTTSKPKIEFRSHGESGNVFRVMAMVRDALRKQSRVLDYNTLYDEVTASGSYAEALTIMRKYAELRDLDGVY